MRFPQGARISARSDSPGPSTNSPRKGRALIKVNCSAVPGNLFESEFFGHMKGAFTGAFKDKPGRFELADGGTLFLDEIGEVAARDASKVAARPAVIGMNSPLSFVPLVPRLWAWLAVTHLVIH